MNAGVKKNNDPRRIISGDHFSTYRNDPQLKKNWLCFKKNAPGISFPLVRHEENDPRRKMTPALTFHVRSCTLKKPLSALI